jgi:manganese-dependent inorganic pyrophosphatase
VATIYVTGHRNPDTDSIASAMGYAELKQRLDSDSRYVPVRLGEVNAQTAWALAAAGVDPPEYLEHVHLRACDVMRRDHPAAGQGDSLRDVGIAMANADADLIPIVDSENVVVGVLTARDIARRYIKETNEPSSFADRPISPELIVDTLGGEMIVAPERRLNGRLWAVTVDVERMGHTMGAHDIVIVGNRTDAQRRAVEIGVALIVTPYGERPDVAPVDSYVTGRLVSQSVPVREVMTPDPLAVEQDDLVADIAERIKDVHYSAALVVDENGALEGIVTRSELVNPEPREVLLVDHAEQAQSVPGIEEAHVVEILDHHHIGSVETRFPVAATFDPVGSTATLVIERFRAAGREPKRPTATMLLAAVLSDTVIMSSPTTTERDRQVVSYLEELLELDATEFGTEMFEASSNVGDVSAEEIIRRDAKQYEIRAGRKICIAQIETVGKGLLNRKAELLDVLEGAREAEDLAFYALMVTDIVARSTELLVAGDPTPIERAFGVEPDGGVYDLPGVMSRKKQVAPVLLQAG